MAACPTLQDPRSAFVSPTYGSDSQRAGGRGEGGGLPFVTNVVRVYMRLLVISVFGGKYLLDWLSSSWYEAAVVEAVG